MRNAKYDSIKPLMYSNYHLIIQTIFQFCDLNNSRPIIGFGSQSELCHKVFFDEF